MRKPLGSALASAIAAVVLSSSAIACGGASMADMAASPASAEARYGRMVTVQSTSADGDAMRESASMAPPSSEPVAKDEMMAGNAMGSPPPPPQSPGAPPPPSAPPTPSKPAPNTTPGSGSVAQVRAPILIYTARLTLAVFEVEKNLKAIEALAKDAGGYLARRDERQIAIRVPVGQFEAVLKKIEKVGDVTARNVETQDVTEEFLDLEVRLKNARAVRDRIEQLLAKATKVEDSIVVERELARVTDEIERLEGRMKYLRDRASFSLITVTFEPRASKQMLPKMSVNMPVPWLYELGVPRLLTLKQR